MSAPAHLKLFYVSLVLPTLPKSSILNECMNETKNLFAFSWARASAAAGLQQRTAPPPSVGQSAAAGRFQNTEIKNSKMLVRQKIYNLTWSVFDTAVTLFTPNAVRVMLSGKHVTPSVVVTLEQ